MVAPNRDYQLYLHRSASDWMKLAANRARRPIAAFLDELADNPFLLADYEELDSTGRPVSVKVIGSSAVIYFVDHAVREIKICQIRPADQ